MKEFCVRKTENCTSILKLNQGQNNVLTPAQQNAMMELKATLKSRSIRRLKDLQKRKYGTSPLLLGVRVVRMEPGNRTGTTPDVLNTHYTELSLFNFRLPEILEPKTKLQVVLE